MASLETSQCWSKLNSRNSDLVALEKHEPLCLISYFPKHQGVVILLVPEIKETENIG